MTLLEILEKGATTYCEKGIGIFDTQPINTLTNIAFIIAAYFSYRIITTHNVKNPLIRILPLLALLTGIGSMLWHGIPGPFTRWADTLPLSLFILMSFFYMLSKLLPNRNLVWGVLSIFVLAEILFIFDILPSLNGFSQYLIVAAFGMLIFVGLARKYSALFPQLASVLLLFILAFLFRVVDLMVCSTFSAGTHFMWHAINGIVVYLLVRLLVEIEMKKLGSRKKI